MDFAADIAQIFILKGQYCHDQSSFSTGHGISVLV